jgi:FtsZ-interacting cell division protein YlmF
MKRRRAMRNIILTFLMTLVPVALFAQVETFPAELLVPGANFITALVVGIILAFGFQLILTNLSAAVGLSAMHSPLESLRKRVTSGGERQQKKQGESEAEPVEEKLRTVNTTFGIWAIITSAMFFAAWLAVEFSVALTAVAGVTLGLAIWGLFYLITAVLEMTAVSSMVGSLMDVARSGFRTVSTTASEIFGTSEEKQAADTTRSIIDAVRGEVFGDIGVRKTIQNYVDQMKPSYRQLSREIEGILDNAEIEIHASPDRETLTARFHTGGMARAAASQAKEKAGAARDIMGEEARTDKERAEKIADATARMAGMSREDAEKYRHRVEDYLARTGKDELSPEGIKRDIDRLVSDPKAGVDSIIARLNEMDRSTITSILAQRKDMDQNEARRVVDMVAGTVNNLKSRYQSTKESDQGATMESQAGMEGRARGFLESTENPELDYEGIKSDFETMLHDPRAGADSLIHRLKSIDRDDIKKMILQSSPNMRDEDAERMVSKVENTRDDVITRAERMRDEVQTRVQQAEETALYHTEEIRKTASSAAWWVFAAALVSGVAAAAGGLVAVIV